MFDRVGTPEPAVCRSSSMSPEEAEPYHRLSEQLLDRWAAFERARVELLDVMAAWDRADAAHLDGVSARTWLRHRFGTTSADAQRMLTLARGLDGHPDVAWSLAEGRISAAKAEIVLGAFTPARRAWAERDAEMLSEHAARLSCSGVHAMMRFWAARADAAAAWVSPAEGSDAPVVAPADGDPADASGGEIASGTLHVAATFEGVTALQATLGADAGATVEAAIELAMAEDRRRRRAEAGLADAADAPGTTDDEATLEDGREPREEGPADPRTLAERRADALVMIAEFFLSHAPSTAAIHGERPKVVVTVDLRTLTTAAGGLATVGDRGALITAEAARRHCCDAGVTRVVTAGPSVVLDVGRTTRTISPHLRTAIVARDRCCRFPGCGVRARFGEVHHIIHWTRGGPTDRRNLALLCWRHHRMVHQGWSMHGDANGVLEVRGPNGRVHLSAPPGRWGP